ncbi:MAG: thiamine-phosphate kinase [Thermodesulfovibrio sp.]|nr:thiamine-phosphate kinase [Thermodesulfovibrio sp.]
MKLAEAGELHLVDRLRKRFSGKLTDRRGVELVLGIGDDAAAIQPNQTNSPHLLLTTDMMVEGVHFDLRWTTLFQLGYKLVSVNVSDICAMGGRPEYLLLNFSCPGSLDLKQYDLFFDGIEAALKKYSIQLIGGDISSSDKIVLSATAVGTASKILRRAGASPGEFIHVTGCLGDAAAGLAIMKNLRKQILIETGAVPNLQLPWNIIEPVIRRHLMPDAVNPDIFIRQATAMMDISDGLLIDLERLCKESKVGARIQVDRLPLSQGLIGASRLLKMSPVDLALNGGEDYELLFTASEPQVVGATCIGEVTRSGLKVIGPDGKQMKQTPKGYEHFGIQG